MTLIQEKRNLIAIFLNYAESTLLSKLAFLSCNRVKSTILSKTMIDTAKPNPPEPSGPLNFLKDLAILIIGAIILVGAFALHGRISFYLLP